MVLPTHVLVIVALVQRAFTNASCHVLCYMAGPRLESLPLFFYVPVRAGLRRLRLGFLSCVTTLAASTCWLESYLAYVLSTSWVQALASPRLALSPMYHRHSHSLLASLSQPGDYAFACAV